MARRLQEQTAKHSRDVPAQGSAVKTGHPIKVQFPAATCCHYDCSQCHEMLSQEPYYKARVDDPVRPQLPLWLSAAPRDPRGTVLAPVALLGGPRGIS